MTLGQMWELRRLLNWQSGADLNSIIQHTHPGLLQHAFLLLYGTTDGIESGAHLIIYLDDGLKANHFQEFLTVTKGQ